LTQLYETEAKSKWQFIAQIEELSNEVKQLREEVSIFFRIRLAIKILIIKVKEKSKSASYFEN
jgi:hypothetical protein